MPWTFVPPLSIPTLPYIGGYPISAGGASYICANYPSAPPRAIGVRCAGELSNDDEGKCVFYEKATDKWIMAADAKFGIVADGTFLAIQATEINGYAWFSDGSRKVYLSLGYAWVYTTALAAGVEPREWYDEDLSAWQGDAFWAGESILTSLAPRGVYKEDGETEAITTSDYVPDYPRWDSDTQFGEYTAAGGATGTRYFGNATWTDEDGNTWIQKSSYRDPAKAKDIYRPPVPFWGIPALTLAWDATKSLYIAGTHGNAAGWWQNAAAPVAGVAYTITFTVPEGSEVTGADIVLTPSDYATEDWVPTKSSLYALDWAVMV